MNDSNGIILTVQCTDERDSKGLYSRRKKTDWNKDIIAEAHKQYPRFEVIDIALSSTTYKNHQGGRKTKHWEAKVVLKERENVVA